jgi:H+/Cl- antiporter ClcA
LVGGGAGQWLSRRGGVEQEDCQAATLSGFAAGFGGVYSSAVMVVMTVLEVARPGGAKFAKVLVSSLVSSSVAYLLAIAGSVFLDAYQVPAYQFEVCRLYAFE